MDKYYTIKEVAEMLKVTERSIHYWKKDGKIKFVKVGRNVRVSETELKRFLEGEK